MLPYCPTTPVPCQELRGLWWYLELVLGVNPARG